MHGQNHSVVYENMNKHNDGQRLVNVSQEPENYEYLFAFARFSARVGHVNMLQKNILFMHGLESGPNGTKARYLRGKFSKVYIPDMQMSAFNPTRRNSPSRVTLCFVVLTIVFAWWRSWDLRITTALVNKKKQNLVASMI